MSDIGNVFPDFAWRKQAERFLNQPEAMSWRTSFALLNRGGRLHLHIQKAQRRSDRHPLLRFELTARGMASGLSREAMRVWFDSAHVLLVRGFADMTGEGVQNNELTYIYTGNPTQEAKPAATKWSGNVLCIVYSPSSEGPWENIAIRFISHPRFPRVGPIGYLLSVEFPPEQSGIATDALTNPHPRPTLRRYFEPELSEPEVGDVYSPAHDREVLFSLEMEFRTADLPRLRAQITLDPLVLAEEEDE